MNKLIESEIDYNFDFSKLYVYYLSKGSLKEFEHQDMFTMKHVTQLARCFEVLKERGVSQEEIERIKNEGDLYIYQLPFTTKQTRIMCFNLQYGGAFVCSPIELPHLKPKTA